MLRLTFGQYGQIPQQLATSSIALFHLLLLLTFGQNGQTPLQLAASRGHLDVVKELAKAGCDLNINTNVSVTVKCIIRTKIMIIVHKLHKKNGCQYSYISTYIFTFYSITKFNSFCNFNEK